MRIFKQIERKGRYIIKKAFLRLLSHPGTPDKFLKPKNVIIVRIDERLGNLVMLNAVVKSFLNNNIETSLVVCKKYGMFFQYNPAIKNIVYFDKKSLFNPFNLIKFIRQLRKENYSLMFDASNPDDLSTLTIFVIALIKAACKFGFDGKDRSLILNKMSPSPQKPGHILDYYTGLFKDLNLKFYKDIKIEMPVNAKKYDYLKEKNKKIIFVHPGGRRSKQWDVRKLLAFLKKIKNNKVKFIIILGPGEMDLENIFLAENYIAIKPGNVVDLISGLSLGWAYIGNDSGPMHAAAALGLAIFAIYKPLSAVMFSPVAKHFEMVISDNPPGLDVRTVYEKYRHFIKNLR